MQEGVVILGYDWVYLYANHAAGVNGRYSKQELIGNNMFELYPGIEHTPMYAALARCMNERTQQCIDTEFVFPDGSRGWFELRIEPVPEGVLLLAVDITLRRELQARLALRQKMDALSRLAGGVAHDFNNILTVIVHSSEFVARALPPDDPSQGDLREIVHVADRGANVVRQLLAFSRRQPRDARPLDLNNALRELMPVVRRLVPESMKIEFVPDGRSPAIRIDQAHLTQVLLALVSNARDAIGAQGTISISTSIVEAEQRVPEQRAPELVCIAVRDNGCGMDELTLTRIFEPFFTTKETREGTGLGLAAAHGIVKQNDGEIRVVSVQQQGTTMELHFPRIDCAEVARRPRSELPKLSGGTEVILVVDDEPTIRGLCSRALTKLGYTVMQCDGPSEALRFVSSYSGPIDLVLSDVVMPEMSGVVLCQKLRDARPELRCLLMSGYVDPEHHLGLDLSQVLSKPFTQADLARRVREVLNAPLPS
jgi:PAS domain S-box-containing protein